METHTAFNCCYNIIKYYHQILSSYPELHARFHSKQFLEMNKSAQDSGTDPINPSHILQILKVILNLFQVITGQYSIFLNQLKKTLLTVFDILTIYLYVLKQK